MGIRKIKIKSGGESIRKSIGVQGSQVAGIQKRKANASLMSNKESEKPIEERSTSEQIMSNYTFSPNKKDKINESITQQNNISF